MKIKRYRIYSSWPVVLVFVTAFSCRPQIIENEAPAVNQVVLGSKFRVNLQEDHKTGYTWQLSEGFDKNAVEQLNAVWHGPEKGIDFNFKAIAVGQTTFSFINRKYNDTSGMKSFVVKIVPK